MEYLASFQSGVEEENQAVQDSSQQGHLPSSLSVTGCGSLSSPSATPPASSALLRVALALSGPNAAQGGSWAPGFSAAEAVAQALESPTRAPFLGRVSEAAASAKAVTAASAEQHELHPSVQGGHLPTSRATTGIAPVIASAQQAASRNSVAYIPTSVAPTRREQSEGGSSTDAFALTEEAAVTVDPAVTALLPTVHQPAHSWRVPAGPSRMFIITGHGGVAGDGGGVDHLQPPHAAEMAASASELQRMSSQSAYLSAQQNTATQAAAAAHSALLLRLRQSGYTPSEVAAAALSLPMSDLLQPSGLPSLEPAAVAAELRDRGPLSASTGWISSVVPVSIRAPPAAARTSESSQPLSALVQPSAYIGLAAAPASVTPRSMLGQQGSEEDSSLAPSGQRLNHRVPGREPAQPSAADLERYTPVLYDSAGRDSVPLAPWQYQAAALPMQPSSLAAKIGSHKAVGGTVRAPVPAGLSSPGRGARRGVEKARPPPLLEAQQGSAGGLAAPDCCLLSFAFGLFEPAFGSVPCAVLLSLPSSGTPPFQTAEVPPAAGQTVQTDTKPPSYLQVGRGRAQPAKSAVRLRIPWAWLYDTPMLHWQCTVSQAWRSGALLREREEVSREPRVQQLAPSSPRKERAASPPLTGRAEARGPWPAGGPRAGELGNRPGSRSAATMRPSSPGRARPVGSAPTTPRAGRVHHVQLHLLLVFVPGLKACVKLLHFHSPGTPLRLRSPGVVPLASPNPSILDARLFTRSVQSSVPAPVQSSLPAAPAASDIRRSRERSPSPAGRARGRSSSPHAASGLLPLGRSSSASSPAITLPRPSGWDERETRLWLQGLGLKVSRAEETAPLLQSPLRYAIQFDYLTSQSLKTKFRSAEMEFYYATLLWR